MGGHCTPPAISRGRGVGGHCLSPPPVGDAEWGGGGGGALRIPYSTSRGRGVGGGGHCISPTVLVGEAEWGGGGTPRPLLLAGVNYKIM